MSATEKHFCSISSAHSDKFEKVGKFAKYLTEDCDRGFKATWLM